MKPILDLRWWQKGILGNSVKSERADHSGEGARELWATYSVPSNNWKSWETNSKNEKRPNISNICKIDQGIDNNLTQDLVIFAVQFESIVEVEVLYYFEYRPKNSQFALYFVWLTDWLTGL